MIQAIIDASLMIQVKGEGHLGMTLSGFGRNLIVRLGMLTKNEFDNSICVAVTRGAPHREAGSPRTKVKVGTVLRGAVPHGTTIEGFNRAECGHMADSR